MSAPGLVQITWPALREYIGVEIRLAIARHQLRERRDLPAREQELKEAIESLQIQSTILETSFREMLPEGKVSDLEEVAARMKADDASDMGIPK